ncbi:PH domain-containing protein [Niallia taxi]|uniref:PH domain-containing protein n=1 Tax=Niallia taxi TaxID=2499688 RepID=UPI0025503040|nr:PH domain-containing protein [Niallia taxi]MDK8643096.1 PH domain-containing protein [Niallia taxi]
MEGRTARLHPVKMLLDFVSLIKTNFIIIFFLYVIHFGTDSKLWLASQYLFAVFILLAIVYNFFNWFFYRYTVKDEAIHISSGVIKKSERVISLSKIQNIQKRTTVIHKLFNISSITMETGESGDNGSIALAAISKQEADWLETIASIVYDEEISEASEEEKDPDSIVETQNEREIHFIASKKDVLKASFTSLSFFALIPVVFTIYSNMEDLLPVTSIMGDWLKAIMRYWWMIAITLVIFTFIAIAFGVITTYWRYGKYQILSDSKRIYIRKGLVDEVAFSILKEKVQAIEVIQSPLKRILRLAEVKLVSAGETGEEDLKTNSLYPFLPVNRAYEIVHELLPEYKILPNMTSLPKTALVAKMLRPSILWLAALVVLLIFKQNLWYVSFAVLLIVYILRLLDFLNSSYIVKDEYMQMRTGSLETSLFLTKRSKVIEVEVAQSRWQRRFGLAKMGIVNRSKPIVHTSIKDVPYDAAVDFYYWYKKRGKDIRIEKQ